MRAAPILILSAAALSACRPGRPAVDQPVPVVATAEVAPTVAVPARPDSQPAALTGGEVTQQAVAAFGMPAAAETPAGDDVADADAGGPSWDISVAPYETNERVEHYVRRYTGPARSWVAERLARGTRYEAMIREKLRAGGVPEDLYYLAFVESGYDPNATSRAAAVGMWQFMAPTAKGLGLRVDWWVDERRDPVRSTEAAARFINYLTDQFGSLYLAAAAYNGGPARVSRGLTRFAEQLEDAEGDDRFFALSEQEFLPRETREYVPQIIAAALVGKNPARYGMEVGVAEAFAYDSVEVPALTSLPAVAKAAGTTYAALRDLNPQFIRAMTPPRRTSMVRLPAGTATGFEARFADIPAGERVGATTVKLEKVTSLANAAKRYSTTAAGIRNFNPRLKRTPKGNLAEGQTLLIPRPEVAAVALTIGDPSTGVLNTRYHVVKSGETLSHIALRNGTTVATIMRLNHLKKPTIFPGQELVVTGTPAAKKPARKSVKKPAKAPAAGSKGGRR